MLSSLDNVAWRCFLECGQRLSEKEAARHPHILALHETFENERFLVLVTDLCCYDLHRFLAKQGRVEEGIARVVVQQVALALQHLHSHGYMHRDVKPQNILLTFQKKIVLADFGHATFIGSTRAQGMCGTVFYAAPETFTPEKYTYHVDWWSTGALCFELLSGQVPFKPTFAAPPAFCELVRAVVAKIRIGVDVLVFPPMSVEANTFVRRLLRQNPQDRLTFPEIQKHPWMAGLKWLQCG
eukprot:s1962_g11.t1